MNATRKSTGIFLNMKEMKREMNLDSRNFEPMGSLRLSDTSKINIAHMVLRNSSNMEVDIQI